MGILICKDFKTGFDESDTGAALAEVETAGEVDAEFEVLVLAEQAVVKAKQRISEAVSHFLFVIVNPP